MFLPCCICKGSSNSLRHGAAPVQTLSSRIAEYPLVGEITKESENASSESAVQIVTHNCHFFLSGLSNSLLVRSNPVAGIKK